MKERAALNTPCMGTYPKQCCHFGVLIASYCNEDEDDDDDVDADHEDIQWKFYGNSLEILWKFYQNL